MSQNVQINLNESAVPLERVLNEIERQTEYLFVYNTDVDIKQKVSVKVGNASLTDALDQLFKSTNVAYTREGSNIILSRRKPADTRSQPARPVTGTVNDSEGQPLAGVTVLVKGTTVGTQTDENGRFRLTLPQNARTLTFGYVGMKPVEIAIDDRTQFSVVLEDTGISMNEVVVTALGIRKEAKSLSYNVQQLSGEELNTVSDPSFVNNLSGKVAGVTINSSSAGAGGSSRVVMRGVKSISGNNNALYVIDGIPMSNIITGQPEDIFSGAGQSGDGVSNLNPDDIESISVLSGPSAAALYGSAAANGVIIVTTKRGQQDKLSINVTNNTTFSDPLILPEFQNTYGQTEVGSYYSWGEKLETPSTYKPSNFFQTGRNVTNSVSLSTGSERNQTYVSLGSVNSEGIIHSNEYDRYNFTIRNTANFLENKMTLDLGFTTSSVKEQNMMAQGQYFNPLIPIYLFPADDDFEKVEIFERYNASRNFKTQFWPYGDQGFSMQNPYWITERNKFINRKDRNIVNATLRYNIDDWINVSARGRMDKSNDKFENKYSASTNTLFASENGFYGLNNVEGRQLYGEVIVNIDRYFNDEQFNLTANIGTSIENIEYDQARYGGKLHSVANLFTYSNINSTTSEVSQTGYEKRKPAAFVSAQLGYRGLAYLDVTGRQEWSSTLAGSSKEAIFYPSVGLAGIVSDIFNFNSDIIPYLKVRGSYSEVGNEPDVFLTIPTYVVNNGYPQTQTRMPNPNLKAELTKSWEAGLNMILFNNKLKVDATVYKSSTFNQFFEPTLSSSSGYTSVIVNAGRIDNKGIELSARYNAKIGKVDFNTFLVYSLNRNKIVELLKEWENPVTSEIISLPELDMGGTGSYKMVLREGGTMGDIYVNTLRTDEHGAIYVNPADGTVAANINNFVYAGTNNPKYNMSWGNQLAWKGLSLSFMFTGRVGGVVVSNTQAIMDAFGASKASADARDAGGALVNGKRVPAREFYQVTGGGPSGGIGSMYVYSATNLRLSEATMGYDIPAANEWAKWIKGINLSLTGRNLFFLYNKAPFDPELTANTGTYFQGIDYFMAPSVRNLGFSVKVQF